MSRSAVVFPTDFSKASLAGLSWAKRMVSVLDAELHCIYVVEEPHVYATLDMGPVPIPTADELATSAQSRLEGFVRDQLGGMDRAVAKVLTGRPADEIVGYAKSAGAEMIVMATHGYSGVKHVILGSTTEAVLRAAECPVLSVRALD